MTDRVGQQLGNYRLVRLLGRGGFAEVYLGQHLRLNMQAAIKVLHTQLADAADIQNFHREAQTIASLIHPHIVRILDFDVKDGVPFLVMDYAPNGSLRCQHPKGVPLPLPTIVSYVKQVADALQYAHDQKLIHRDVKPENMLLGRQNEVLLSDFGTAIIAQSSRYQGTQDMVGTIAYMAPEQIQAHPRPASDQYALGVVYEWLRGVYPFQGSFSEIAAKHTMMPPPSLRGKIPTISPELEQVVMVALAKDPRQRFASVTEPIRADLACQWVVLSELHLDRAYLSSLWVRERPAALQIYCKAWPVRNGTRFPKTAFQLDWQHQVIECPNHVVLPFEPGESCTFLPRPVQLVHSENAARLVNGDVVSRFIPMNPCCMSYASGSYLPWGVPSCVSAWPSSMPWLTLAAGKVVVPAIEAFAKTCLTCAVVRSFTTCTSSLAYLRLLRLRRRNYLPML